jgi:predicted nucleic acid-binding protein
MPAFRRSDANRLSHRRRLTDTFLIALATHHKGRLVTFDETIILSAVPSASEANLVVI